MSASSTEAYLQALDGSPANALVEIVADGGRRLGFGHVGRCLALWEELEGRAAFRVEDETVARFLQARGVPSGPAAVTAPLVLLDRAEPTSEEEVRSLQAGGRRVALLDDLGSGRMAADVVIDPPTAAAWPPAGGLRLAGFEHVLLRREVREACKAASAPRLAESPTAGGAGLRFDATSSEGDVDMRCAAVLLAMGGSDPAGLTAPLSEALLDAGIDAAVALGPGYRGPCPVARTIAADAFAGALARAALLICGYGHSLLEAAHLGVPAIAVVFRPEHLPHAEAFCCSGTACMLDMTGGVRAAELAALVDELLGDAARRAAMASRGRELVDGAGAGRVAVALRERV